MAIHPRISLNSICSMNFSLAEDFALWEDLGITNVGLVTPKIEDVGWEPGRQAVIDAGVVVSNVSSYLPLTMESLAFTAAVGAEVLYTVSGRAGSTPWDEAAEKFCIDLAPAVARANELGLRLAVEPTNPLRSDVSFVHSVRDAIDLARMAGMSIVIDFYSAWYERNIAELVADNIDLVALVQICDYKFGTFSMPNRCAIGDGNIPVERMLAMVLSAGYTGPFDLEILGPVIEAEGYRAPIARSVERATEMLERLGA